MNKLKKYTKLYHSIIVGYVDENDVVHSTQLDEFSDKTHIDIFGKKLKGFRWSFQHSIEFSVYAGNVSFDEIDLIRNHLTSKYGIQWWENGYHDLDHFIKMLDKEKSE
jgi:hypothetical protein